MSGYVMVAARPAIGQAVFDQAKRAYLLRTGRPITALLTFGEALACGAAGRLVATLICYPCFKLKVSPSSRAPSPRAHTHAHTDTRGHDLMPKTAL